MAGTAFAVVAESDGVIVGQATNRLGAGTAVLGIVVAAAHRGGGLGRRLLAACERAVDSAESAFMSVLTPKRLNDFRTTMERLLASARC